MNSIRLRETFRSVVEATRENTVTVSTISYGIAVRRNRTLKDDETVLERLEAEGIDPERVLTVDTSKLDDALEVTSLSESDVYEIEESEYVRKADVDEEMKETRLQGLKDQLAGTDEDATELKAEIEELEQRINELTSFDSGTSFHTRSTGG